MDGDGAYRVIWVTMWLQEEKQPEMKIYCRQGPAWVMFPDGKSKTSPNIIELWTSCNSVEDVLPLINREGD